LNDEIDGLSERELDDVDSELNDKVDDELDCGLVILDGGGTVDELVEDCVLRFLINSFLISFFHVA